MFEIKIKEFIYKLLTNILATQQNLHKWHISPTNICFYCTNHVQDEIHMLYQTQIKEMHRAISADTGINMRPRQYILWLIIAPIYLCLMTQLANFISIMFIIYLMGVGVIWI